MAHEIPSQHRPGQSSPDLWPRAFKSSFAINKRGRCQNTGKVRDLLDLLAAGMGIKPAGSKAGDQGLRNCFFGGSFETGSSNAKKNTP